MQTGNARGVVSRPVWLRWNETCALGALGHGAVGVGMGLAKLVLLLAEEMVVVMVDGSGAREGALEMA
jgi:hypothetical protein